MKNLLSNTISIINDELIENLETIDHSSLLSGIGGPLFSITLMKLIKEIFPVILVGDHPFVSCQTLKTKHFRIYLNLK